MAGAMGTVGVSSGQFVPGKKSIEGLYPGKAYSPHAQRSFPSRVYWGDTHLHTGYSMDAGLFGNTTGHDTAYKFARGEEVKSASGQPVKLARPLDWLVLTDHSDGMGMIFDLKDGAPNILKSEQGKRWSEALQKGGEDSAAAALDLITNFSQGTMDETLTAAYSPGAPAYRAVWEKTVEAAEKYNDPGTFTAFIGYEWTSLVKGNNLHRNVIFRDDADKALQVEPMVTQPPVGSADPMDLYAWLEAYEKKTGGQVFAIAHNGNLSNGGMFPTDERRLFGDRLDKKYIEARARWEPLYEISQIKGDGETHPKLSPDDEFADYETWDAGNLDLTEAKTVEMLKGEYAREALKQGFALEKKWGINPYRFGFSGATDSHTSLSTADSDNYFGKATNAEPSQTRAKHPFTKTDKGEFPGWSLVASGYTGVWAKENTRKSLWDAMVRRECYGTTGPRMMVRFFGGWDFDDDDLRSRSPAFRGYKKGVPMGGELPKKSGEAPTFMLYALRDPIGANLDRLQVIKGWMDSAGQLHERVYDVAVSGDRKIGEDGRCKEPVGDTVDLEAANWTNTIGASELASVWTDPDFDPSASAFYYARVLEIPTPRWVVYDQVRLGAKLPETAVLKGQERGYTSPIWYSPAD